MSKTETQSEALNAERRLSITAVANLELRKKFGDEGFRLDLERDELEALIEMAERVSRLNAENKDLRARLEIDPSHPIDGIAARDETIRQLEAQVKELHAKAARYDYIKQFGTSGETESLTDPRQVVYASIGFHGHELGQPLMHASQKRPQPRQETQHEARMQRVLGPCGSRGRGSV